MSSDPRRWWLAGLYALGALLCLLLAVALGGWALLLLWPALSLLLVSLAYGAFGVVIFGKDADGRISSVARVSLGPYLLGARVNAWLWGRRLPASTLIAPGIRLGRVPARRLETGTVIDLTAEIEAPAGAGGWRSIPMLDLVTPEPRALFMAANAIESAVRVQDPESGEVLVCCALGVSRSAAVVAVWLAAYGGAAEIAEAIAILRARRPQVRLGAADLAAIHAAVACLKSEAAAGANGAAETQGALTGASSSKAASALAPYISDGPPPM